MAFLWISGKLDAATFATDDLTSYALHVGCATVCMGFVPVSERQRSRRYACSSSHPSIRHPLSQFISLAIYSRVPPDTEVLLTHTPSYGVRDLSKHGIQAGCRVLASRLEDLRKCRLHVFGHIHESHGYEVREVGEIERVSVNGALAYGGQAIIVDLKNDL